MKRHIMISLLLALALLLCACSAPLEGTIVLENPGAADTEDAQGADAAESTADAAASAPDTPDAPQKTARTADFLPTPYAESYSPMDIDFDYPSFDVKADSETFTGEPFNAAEAYANANLTVLNIWTTSCPICVEAMPVWEELSREYAGSGVQFVGVCADAQAREGAAFEMASDIIVDRGLSYPQLLASEELIEKLLASVMYVPTTYFIDSEGNTVSSMLVGYADKESMVNVIETMVAHLV